jgi:uncharacterized protein (TIGR02186 family)
MRSCRPLPLAAMSCLLLAFPARSTGLVADLSHHLVAITTAFAGSDVLLFGTVGAPGRDVVVTVRGPLADTSVRRKTEIGFIWLNTQEVVYTQAPEFYAVASSAPLSAIADPAELARNQIGTEHLALKAISIEGVGDRHEPVFRAALIRRKEQAGLYAGQVGRVLFIGGDLFRTTLQFPANVPPGNYEVRVFELEEGFVVAAQASSLIVSKVGLEADLYDIAHRLPLLYAAAAIVLAVFAGWSAAVIFKRN